LNRYGARIKAVEDPRATGIWSYRIEARLEFPKLDHAATPADIRDGLAIFSLADEGQARTVAFSPRPAPARWSGPKNHSRREADQTGVIWQAEELRTENGWRRYYGFVGPHTFARVPADEVELLREAAPDRPIR
jgi:hypothetical protein